MTHSQAQRIVDTEDYQPWHLVEQAKQMLGIVDAPNLEVERLCEELRARKAQRNARG